MIKSKITQADDNVFLALGFSVEEAENLRIRADLMIVLRNLIRAQNWTTKQAASYLRTSETQVQALMSGEIDQFQVKSLIAMLPYTVMRIRFEALPKVA
jgi:predicted XRE-type DNA-binding protein